jgi:hypothetical protein
MPLKWIGKGGREDRKKEDNIVHRVGIRIKFIVSIKNLSISSARTRVKVENPIQ